MPELLPLDVDDCPLIPEQDQPLVGRYNELLTSLDDLKVEAGSLSGFAEVINRTSQKRLPIFVRRSVAATFE